MGNILLAKWMNFVAKWRPMLLFVAMVALVVGVLNATGWKEPVSDYLATITFSVGKYRFSMLELMHGVVVLVVVFWLASVSSRTLENNLRHSSLMSYATRELTVKFFRVFAFFAALLVGLSALGVDLTAFAVFGGALGVGIGLGLQKITSNFVSGVTLLMEKSIKLGDLIEVGGILGWVRQLNIRYTLVETLDGRAFLIPNEELISTRVISWTYTDNQARIEILVKTDFNADPAKALSIMLAAAKAHPKCLRSPEPTCFLTEFTDTGMQFSLTFWIANIKEGRASPRNEVMLGIVRNFREAGIAFAELPLMKQSS